MAEVFVSHSSADRAWVDDFSRSLKPYGLATWTDNTLRPGEDIETLLRKALVDSDIVVAVIDSSSATLPNVLFELGAAAALGKKLFLIVRDQEGLSHLPFNFSKQRFLVESSPERAAQAVASAVSN
jgi:nucleoside 2-deoxyribosyltransferase